jgi:serine/threonine-protein kinase
VSQADAPKPVPNPAPIAATPPAAPIPPPAATPSVDDDDAAIRRVIASYARAIEAKDLDAFRAVKPNLSGDEQRRLEDGFKAVTSQKVDITVLSIEHRAATALVKVRRRDTLTAGGRAQTSDSQQTMTLVRSGTGWVIREIGG